MAFQAIDHLQDARAAALFPRAVGIIRSGMYSGLHIGAQVHIRHKGQVVADFAYGYAAVTEQETPTPLHRNHRMLWLSAGKPLTAVAIALLQEKGLLHTEDPVSRHIPEFTIHGKGLITIRNLLTHTQAYQAPVIDWPRLPWTDIIDRICAARIPEGRQPGGYASYDPQTGWYLLAEVIRRVAGVSHHLFIEEQIWKPLRCTESSIGLMPQDWSRLVHEGEIARLHDTSRASSVTRPSANETGIPSLPVPAPHPWAGDDERRAAAHNPGGGALGPVRDLGVFYQWLLDALNARSNSPGPALTRAGAQGLTDRLRTGLVDHAFHQKVDWGLGFMINSRRYGAEFTPYGYGLHAGESTFGHGGIQSSTAYADPENELVVAAVFNGLPGEQKHNRRVHDFNSAVYEDLALINPKAAINAQIDIAQASATD